MASNLRALSEKVPALVIVYAYYSHGTTETLEG